MTAARMTPNGSLDDSLPAERRVKAAWKVKAITSPEGPHPTCVVEEVSLGGARLLVPQDAHLPARVSLYVPLRDETHEVEVSWRNDEGSEIGVNFLEPNERPAPKSQLDPAVRIAQLEAHIDHLEEQNRKLENRVNALMERVTRLEFP